MPTYHVEDPLQHDGKRYEPGDSVTMPEKQAAVLLDIKVVSGPIAEEGENRLEAITAAIMQLDKDNPDLWTNDHKPQVKAIEEITGFDITAAERDEAWESVG